MGSLVSVRRGTRELVQVQALGGPSSPTASDSVTVTDITIVRHSFGMLTDMQQLGEAFYEELFNSDPGVKSMFFSDQKKQAERLMAMLGLAIGKLDDLRVLIPALEALARRHLKYGVTALHYPLVGEALIKVLAKTLGPNMTEETKAAWLKVYGMISSVMLNAAKNAGDDEHQIDFRKEEQLWATTDSTGVLLSCSPEFCASLGYPSSELVGRSICAFQPAFVGGLHDGYMRRYAAGKTAAVPASSPDGSPSTTANSSTFISVPSSAMGVAIRKLSRVSTSSAPDRAGGAAPPHSPQRSPQAQAPIAHPREVALTTAAGGPKYYNLTLVPVPEGFMAIFKDRTAHRETEQQRDKLLQEVLPVRISQMLLANPKALIAKKYPCCSIFFSDVVGFTTLSSSLDSGELLGHLNMYYNALDDLLRLFQLLKVKTIGDAYMCAAGMPDICEGDATSLACFALQMLTVLRTRLHPKGLPFRCR
eukprot:RCo039255